MDEVVEYLFLTRPMADRFADQLKARGLVYAEGSEVLREEIFFRLQDDLADEVWDELDELYHELYSQEQAFLAEPHEKNYSSIEASIALPLANGQQTFVKVEPELLSRVLSVLSLEELNHLLADVVSSVESAQLASFVQKS